MGVKYNTRLEVIEDKNEDMRKRKYSKTDLDERTRILFVDDMPICCNIFMKGLSGEYSTYWAKNREEALGQIKKGNYDLVITDYHLGDEAPEGGLDVIAESCRQGLPVISISKEDHKSESLDTGAKRFVFKKEFFNNIENIISDALENERR